MARSLERRGLLGAGVLALLGARPNATAAKANKPRKKGHGHHGNHGSSDPGCVARCLDQMVVDVHACQERVVCGPDATTCEDAIGAMNNCLNHANADSFRCLVACG